jgi:hypothetical protein
MISVRYYFVRYGTERNGIQIFLFFTNLSRLTAVVGCCSQLAARVWHRCHYPCIDHPSQTHYPILVFLFTCCNIFSLALYASLSPCRRSLSRHPYALKKPPQRDKPRKSFAYARMRFKKNALQRNNSLVNSYYNIYTGITCKTCYSIWVS